MLQVITMTVLLPCPSHCDPTPAVSNTLMTTVYHKSLILTVGLNGNALYFCMYIQKRWKKTSRIAILVL